MHRYIHVVIPPLPTPYTYIGELGVHVGDEVLVPLGKRTAKGFVIDSDVSSGTNEKVVIKEILPTKQRTQLFHKSQLEFFDWIAQYYRVPLSQVIDVAVPPRLNDKKIQIIELIQPQPEKPPRGNSQRSVIEFLAQNGPTPTAILSRHVRGARSTVGSLAAGGYVSISDSKVSPEKTDNSPAWAKKEVTLSASQSDAYKKIILSIQDQIHQPFLLLGATGSGKTEVYIEAIKYCVSLGKSALIVVPEIALTPQLVDRFRARLGTSIAVLHSALNRRTRWDSWQALLKGESKVAIGARSGIFAPLENLGLIVVDEEHDSSYKQNDGLRYNARDLALVRGKLSSCPVILGSATPSLESLSNAQTKKYTLLSLDNQGNKHAQNEIEIIDLNLVKPYDMPSRSLSPQLVKAVQEALQKKEQIFVLYNRRGFASYLQCDTCEQVITCPHCSVTLTYHQNTHSLVCHYCNSTQSRPTLCPHCSRDGKSSSISERGAGTERVFEELKDLFPEAKIARLDRDSVQKLKDYEEILNGIRSGEIDIVVGTQMIAKGHDLPNVTLAAVVDCDVGIHMPDFRSGERVFQLLTQLAGRAGRGEKKGKVLLQTRVPNHPSITCTAKQNFLAFAQQTLHERQALGYPPYGRLLRVICASIDEEVAKNTAKQIASVACLIRDRDSFDVTVLGPAPTPIAKIRNEWRWHLMVKGSRASDVLKLFYVLQKAVKRTQKVKVLFDLDPQEML